MLALGVFTVLAHGNEFGPVPAADAVKPALASLGKRLFFDRRLSGDATLSCASCHQPDNDFADGMPLGQAYIVRQALVDTHPAVRLEALLLVPLLAEEADCPMLESLLGDEASSVRIEALKQWLRIDPMNALTRAVPMLFANGGFDRKSVAQAVTDDQARLSLANALARVILQPARQRDWCFAIEALAEILGRRVIN